MQRGHPPHFQKRLLTRSDRLDLIVMKRHSMKQIVKYGFIIMDFLQHSHLLLANVTVEFQMNPLQNIRPFIGISHSHKIENILNNPMGKKAIVHVLHVERNSRPIELVH
ncbi:hypothetical protein D3C74_352380 [compost metagenome]